MFHIFYQRVAAGQVSSPVVSLSISLQSVLLCYLFVCFTAKRFTLKAFQQLKGHNLFLLIGPHNEHITLNPALVPKVSDHLFPHMDYGLHLIKEGHAANPSYLIEQGYI